MIAEVMGYTAAIALLFALTGYGVERTNLSINGWRRWIWATTMLLSFAYPTVVLLRAPQPMTIQPSATPPPTTASQLGAVKATTRASVITTAEANAPPSRNPLIKEQRWLSGAALNLTLTVLWVSSSSVLALWLLIGRFGLYRSARGWPEEQVDGYRVRVAAHTGPAVVGFWQPFIVLPRWLLRSPVEIRSMVLQHEAQHLTAGDPAFVLFGLILVVLTPWNLPLWWQLRRLRFALEVDCDARVRRGGADMNMYAKMLLAVCERSSRIPVAALAMSARRSDLEQRVSALLVTASRPQWVTAGVIAASVAVVASATQLPAPEIRLPATVSAQAPTDRFASTSTDQSRTVPTRTISIRTLWEPPPLAPGLEESPGLPKANGSKEIVAALNLANIHISLENTPFTDIQAHLGGALATKGEAGNNRQWLCYHAKASPLPWIIWVEGDELHRTSVAGFQWRAISHYSIPDGRCQALPDASAVSLPVDISLGQSRRDVRAVLGPPTAEYRSVWVYFHTHPATIRGTPFTVDNTVTILFLADKVEAIEVWKTSTD